MKRTLKIILFTIVFIVFAYTGLWFAVLVSLSNSINEKYADTYIDVGNSEQYFIKFSKVKPYGFPFKWGVSLVDWQEESINRQIEFHSPINIGYDLLKQTLFVSLSGEALGRFKPVERGFGAKFYNDSLLLTARMPLCFELIKILGDKERLFEVINFIEDIKFTSGKVEIFDLVDNKKLYEEDHTALSVFLDKNKYYVSVQDFLDNIPRKLEINYDTEITQSNLEDRIIPAGLLLYRLAWYKDFKFSGNLAITTDSKSFKDLTKDLNIKINNAKVSSNNFEGNINLLYKGSLDGFGNNKVHLVIDSQVNPKQSFISGILEGIKKYYDKQAYLLKMMNNEIYENLNGEVINILSTDSQFDFSSLEDREYDLNLNINLVTENNNLTRVQINSLSLYSKQSGFNITNETIVNILKNSYSKGAIIINNYDKIIDVLSPYIYGAGKFKNFSEESKEVYNSGLKTFLKTISDHPNSSNLIDVSIDYELDLSDLNKTKIGTIDDINKIIPLYYLSLYQAAVKKVKVGENVKEKIIELIPDFKEYQKVLKECMLPGFQEVEEIIK
ncbi:MAG TPA: hypothetical protein LFW21_05320 [Rickettsia endosymbiont of Pyrocoelia pectoralis]|nr:hypothetical protein [Rickettsia endosymbiont of Pyrocoelia pectoralis]